MGIDLGKRVARQDKRKWNENVYLNFLVSELFTSCVQHADLCGDMLPNVFLP